MKRFLFTTLSALLTALLLNGCPAEIKGPERQNIPPEVHFVNIPAAGARFSTDTTIYWYGTDADGFIVQYRYAVIRTIDIITEDTPDVESFLAQINDDELPWVILNVNLKHPQTDARITMSADISDPVRTYVESYVFLQAIDNLGAKSRIIYRAFLKNNHFPNTFISAQGIDDPYINAEFPGGLLDGVSIRLTGEDPIDYPRNPPPFEFQWKLFGPFDTCQLAQINADCVCSVFVDIYGDFYSRGDRMPVPQPPDTTVDTTANPDTLIITYDTAMVLVDTLGRGNPYGRWQEEIDLDIMKNLNLQTCYAGACATAYRVADSSYDSLTGEPWVYDMQVDIINVFRHYPVDTTSLYYFLFWCQVRDDSKVPDPVPAYEWVSVIDPKFERDIIIIDATPYYRSMSRFWNWPKFPQQSGVPAVGIPADIPYVKHIFGQMINDWAVTVGKPNNIFDIHRILDDRLCPNERSVEYCRYQATQDYYPTHKLRDCEQIGIYAVTLRDILKHKVIILIKDMPGEYLLMNHAITLAVLDGLRAGMSCWAMLRSPFPIDPLMAVPEGTYQNVPAAYREFFGIENMWHTCWMGMINDDLDNPGIRIEDFVGADVIQDISPIFPNLPIDTLLLEDRYLWVPGPAGFDMYDYRCHLTGEILLGSLPEVGFVEKYPAAEAVYLYKSKYGTNNPQMVRYCYRDVGRYNRYDGAVVAVRLNAGSFRTSHFSFSLLPIVEDSARIAFNAMMDWLYEPFNQPGFAGKRAIEKPTVDIEKIKQITQELHKMKALGLLEISLPDND